MPSLWVFDLDGTLIDVEARYLRIHGELLAARGASVDPSYWAKKRDKTPEPEIARACGLGERDAEAYAAERLGLLEDPRYLALDRVFPGAFEVLRRIGPDRAVLATRRKDRAALDRQLEQLRLRNCFSRVLTPVPGAGKETLHPAIRAGARPGTRIVSVTDSPQDIVDGKASGFVTVAVLSGLRSRRFIEPTVPDVIVGSIAELSLEEIEHVSSPI
jgi:phosphoglycolate phosphatase-like HAD superfamily hydrolase